MEKGIFVQDIGPGSSVEGVFVIEQKRLLDTRSGAPYLALTLLDRTGRIEARLWENAPQAERALSSGDTVLVRGEGQSFRESLQLKLSHIERIEACEPGFFLPVTPEDRDALWKELWKIAKGVKTPALAALLRAVFRDDGLARAFRSAPAAKRMHHAYIGGLLEHSVSVARSAEAACRLYPALDRDLLVTGALLHDIGKIRELRYDVPPLDYTDEGRLLGHIVLGISIIDACLAGMPPADPSTEGGISALKHLVLSHHGQREFGSPVLPMTEEALVLNLIDDLDAKLNYMKGLRKTLPEGRHSWTEYQKTLERYLYLPGLRPPGVNQAESGASDEGPMAGIQAGLWD